ncbi:hypothetical protein FPZ24_02765 [Sphingomonas panacisoli]|uniref:Uncharacterized protein n=1 Tax=Sphingomonas panacisoli TaxID=1813879 RepID=A0A5B8LFK3_9SPHN|nr:hypothetical protein [Sphingomonas panacisoli]QDZ06525.1 hypothetical protein FPZ24_02765 [Sphingomonas panacisoli]
MLPIHGSLNTVRENFARQFVPDRDGYVYRRRQRGEAFRVTAAERDRFVADFDRGVGRLFWGGLVTLIAVMAVFEIWPTILPPDWQARHEVIVAVGASIAFLIIWWRLSSAPDRALERRVPMAGALDAAARRRVNFAGLPWAVLIFGAVLTLGMIAQAFDQPGPTDWTYVVGGAIGFAFFVLLGAIKWRITRS